MINQKYIDQLDILTTALCKMSIAEGCRALFYAEAGEAWAGGSIFFDRPASIEWVDPRDLLRDVTKLWEVTSHNQRWQGVTIFADGDQFKVTFEYGENWLKEEDEGDRRTPIVHAHFGNKPLSFPPFAGADY